MRAAMDKNQDKLDIIFRLQEKLDNDIIKNRDLENITKEEWIQKEVLAIISELSELLSEVNFKWWKNPKEINYDNVKEELVDILHFFISLCLKSGMTSRELYDLYIKKNEENFKRQYGTSIKQGYEIEKLKK
jgi:dimeric dUTPase (all-alpha-NTP-PPase superfamily)